MQARNARRSAANINVRLHRIRLAELQVSWRDWELVEPVFSRRRQAGGRPSCDRRLLEAILYVAWSRSSWRKLPSRLGKPNSVARTFARWCDDGTIDELLAMFPSCRHRDDETSGADMGLQHRLTALVELQHRHWRAKQRHRPST